MIHQLRFLTTLLLGGLLLWAPLPFASITARGSLVLHFGCAVVLLSAVAFWYRRSQMKIIFAPAVYLLAFSIWGLFQSLALPAEVVRWVSPKHHELFTQAGLAVTGATARSMPLSLEASTSRRTAVWCVALFSAFVAAGLAGRHRIHRRWLMVALLTAGLFEVLYGGKLWIERATTLWGAGIPGGEGRLRGTFVNSNHLALYLNLALAATFAWLWWSYRRSQRMLDWDRRVLVMAPPLIVWLTLFLGLAFTKSRAGLLAALLGTLVQALLVPTRTPLEPSSGSTGRLTHGKPRRKRLLVGGGLGLVGLAVVAAIGSQEAASRWQLPSLQDFESNRRLQVYTKTLDLWSQFPLTGTGLGSFRDGFPLVQPPGLVEEWHHAHNDWLELLATTGIIGTGLFLAGLGMLLRRLARVLASGRRTEDRAAALAALGAMAAAGVHSFFDFGLTMPATAFTLVVLLGSAAGARLRH